MAAPTSRRTAFVVFAVLLALLAATVAVAYVDLGPLNTSVALLIASLKALLVMAWFMHLKSSERLNWVFAAASFLFLGLLLGLTLADVVARG